MQTAQGILAVIGANTPDFKMYWNGQGVPDIKSIGDNTDPCREVVTYHQYSRTSMKLSLGSATIFAKLGLALPPDDEMCNPATGKIFLRMVF